MSEHALGLSETIVAPASAPGPGARAIVRVSGPLTKQAVKSIFNPNDSKTWEAVTSAWRHVGELRLSRLTQPIEAAVMLWPTSRSYTGQPLAEVHLTGSPPLVEVVVEELCLAGARSAQRGEFTLRAFLAGRIDLTQAEAVLGVIDAEDSASLQQALSQLAGGISEPIAHCREQLLLHLADLEAGLDFVEEDIEFVSREELTRRLEESLELIDTLLQASDERMQSTGRARVVIAGLPNAGKSTLLNCLAHEDVAIVSSQAGTTRDYISRQVELGSLVVDFIDTAGWESMSEGAMAFAQTQRTDEVERADLLLWCSSANLDAEQRLVDQRLCDELVVSGVPVCCLLTRIDLAPDFQTQERTCPTGEASLPFEIAISCETGAGLDDLKSLIVRRLSDGANTDGEIIASTAARCRDAFHQAREGLANALTAAQQQLGDELIAIDLREGLQGLAIVAGTVYTDDILDRIFSRFCIGK